MPPASICCSSLVRHRWPGEAVPCSSTRATAWCGANPELCKGGGEDQVHPVSSTSCRRKASMLHGAGFIRLCYCMFYHHGLLEAQDSVLGVCISMFTLALTSSQHLVPKETCREACESRYSAAERFAAASAALGYFYEEHRAHAWPWLTISLPGQNVEEKPA